MLLKTVRASVEHTLQRPVCYGKRWAKAIEEADATLVQSIHKGGELSKEDLIPLQQVRAKMGLRRQDETV